MNRIGLAQAVIDALPEPAFLLTGTGGIIGANRAVRGLLGDELARCAAAGGDVAGCLVTPPDDIGRYLARCRATSTPMPGALVFRTADGERRIRVHCARLSGRVDEPMLLLRCADPRGDRFPILAERVRQLDAELRQRVREKAVLHEALDENRTLMRELQHRVKNNIQMMISLLSMSSANGGSAEVRAFVDGAKERFRALATTQDLISEAQSASVIPARDLLGRLARALAESTDGAVEIGAEVEDITLPQENAHCLALIVNELVTNSIKHGTTDGSGTIRISLDRRDGQIRLAVQDDGAGYADLDSLPRSSGLTLVRGLCRQIGAGLQLDNDGGARSVVSFADSRAKGAAAADAAENATESGAGGDGRNRLAAGTPAST